MKSGPNNHTDKGKARKAVTSETSLSWKRVNTTAHIIKFSPNLMLHRTPRDWCDPRIIILSVRNKFWPWSCLIPDKITCPNHHSIYRRLVSDSLPPVSSKHFLFSPISFGLSGRLSAYHESVSVMMACDG